MKQLLVLFGSITLACAFASADTFTGKLIDSACAQQQSQPSQQQQQQMHQAACTPTSATTSFAIDVSGKVYKLDAEGNKKAADAWKKYNSSADRAQNPNSAGYQVTATVQGSMKDDEIKVDSIDVH